MHTVTLCCNAQIQVPKGKDIHQLGSTLKLTTETSLQKALESKALLQQDNLIREDFRQFRRLVMRIKNDVIIHEHTTPSMEGAPALHIGMSHYSIAIATQPSSKTRQILHC